VFCRSEATKLYNAKPAINAAGCDLVCLLKENIDEEVAEFHTEDYWPGDLYLDNDLVFYKALGGGTVHKASLLSFLNPWSSIYKKYGKIKTEVKASNLKGEGTITGGLYVVGAQGGVQYQFAEKEFGDHAPLEEVLAACKAAAAANAAK